MQGRYIGNHTDKQVQNLQICLQILLPCQIVHIRERDMDLLPDGQQIIFRIIRVKFRVSGCEVLQFHRLAWIKDVDRFQRVRNQLLNALQGQAERMHRAFQPLEQVDAH